MTARSRTLTVAPMASEDLESRVERLERELALYRLIATYGPAVDSGSASAAAALWADDGNYDFGDGVLEGAGAVEAMIEGRAHQSLIHEGVAHMLGIPLVDIDGDHAVVTCYSQVCRRVEDGFRVWRVSANRWELNWDVGRWRTTERRAYVLDGSERARLLLGRGAAATSGAG